MNSKENPGGKAGESSKSSLLATQKTSHQPTENASEKRSQGQQRRPRAGTQLATVLFLLESRPGGFVGVNEIMARAHCAAAHSAISTLRRRYGFRIRNRLRRSKEGLALSEYQLEEEVK